MNIAKTAIYQRIRPTKKLPLWGAHKIDTVYQLSVLVERATGIEPASAAWEAAILPMNYAREEFTSRRGGPIIAEGGEHSSNSIAHLVSSRNLAADNCQSCLVSKSHAEMGDDFACHLRECGLIKNPAYSANIRWVEPDNPVEPHLGFTPTRIPRAGPDVHPIASLACFLSPIEIMIDAGQWHRQKPITVLADDERRPVLAARGVLFKRHPRPHYFARIGCLPRTRGVDDAWPAPEVPRIGLGVSLGLRR